MRTLKAAVLAVAIAVSVPAHAEHPLAAYRLLVAGHTIAQATAILGPAISQTVIAPNKVLVQWMDVGPMGAHHVAILFSADGRMLGVQHVFGL